MELVADLHLHSKYSRAVSSQMDIEGMVCWAKKKGIGLLGTGDWTHPLWLKELKECLEEKDGILEVRSEKREVGREAGSKKTEVKFLLSTEISSIYSQGGKLRRIHNLIFAPSFRAVDKIIQALKKAGANLSSDGRPIIGLSAKALTELVLTADKECLIVPAHIWTPWFSLFGSKSGFDSIEECFGSYSQYIYAIETGISSDPGMNWRIGDLANRAIVSFSDAHSLPKMGREATIFEIADLKNLRYEDVAGAIKTRGEKRPASPKTRERTASRGGEVRNEKSNSQPHISSTIEFYPEEGKYHYTGHRNCQIRQAPEETKRLGETCPVCGRPLTLGVTYRVEELISSEPVAKTEIESDKFNVRHIRNGERPSYLTIVPLIEILAESRETSVGSRKVLEDYDRLIEKFGSEFAVLLRTSFEEIAEIAGAKVAEGIKKVRAGEIVIDPGYDGVYGMVKIWENCQNQAKISSQNGGQASFF